MEADREKEVSTIKEVEDTKYPSSKETAIHLLLNYLHIIKMKNACEGRPSYID